VNAEQDSGWVTECVDLSFLVQT